jgi:hypothetical protein
MHFGSALLTGSPIAKRFWEFSHSSSGTLTILVTLKYLSFVMRADNQGEGGILTLLSLAFPKSVRRAEKSKLFHRQRWDDLLSRRVDPDRMIAPIADHAAAAEIVSELWFLQASSGVKHFPRIVDAGGHRARKRGGLALLGKLYVR